jgi:hypothetical protein
MPADKPDPKAQQLAKAGAAAAGDERARRETATTEPDEPQAEPKRGEALDAAGTTVEQVGKDPGLPADVPVSPGTALDPALPPLRPQEPVLE